MNKAFQLLVISLLCFLVGCSSNDTDITPTQASRLVIDSILAGDVDIIHKEWFDGELQDSFSVNELKEVLNNHKNMSGDFVEIGEIHQSNRGDEYHVFEAELKFSNLTSEVRMVFNDQLKLVGFDLSEGIPNISLPDTIIEEEIVVGEGTNYELNGILTLPKETHGQLPAVVLVHGSGPSDKDESVYRYKPFRDIAWGLAQQGIAAIRYDKRTFTYGSEMIQETKHITVYEETIEDAIRATQLLKNDKRIDNNQVYILGHSLGAMLAPRIDSQGGDYSGIIMLAGSPRPLTDIIYDQNQWLLEQVTDESVKKEQADKVEQEYEKAIQLQRMSDEEAKEVTVFGIDGYYVKEMSQYDIESIVLNLEKPILIMQGEDDFQVFYDKDFAVWQELLKERENATLISYPGLNHFFVHYEGLAKGTIAEYNTPGQVKQEVITDIGDWLLKHNNN